MLTELLESPADPVCIAAGLSPVKVDKQIYERTKLLYYEISNCNINTYFVILIYLLLMHYIARLNHLRIYIEYNNWTY